MPITEFLYLEDAIFDNVDKVNHIINLLAGGPRYLFNTRARHS